MIKRILQTNLTLCCLLGLTLGSAQAAPDTTPEAKPFLGRWALTLPGGGAGWLGVEPGAAGLKAGVPLLPAGSASDVKRNWESGLFNNPRLIRLSLIGSELATSACRLIWLAPPNIIPLVLIT